MNARLDLPMSEQPVLAPDIVEHVMSQVVEFAPHGVALTMPDGRIVLVNAELERMFGYARAELLHTDMERLVPERFRASHAAFREGNWNDFKPHAMGAGRELLGLRADGGEFPIEIGINALRTPAGMMIVETVIDISVRKRLERMFQKIVEAAPCGIVMIDAGGRIVLVNPQAESMFGYTLLELIGNPLEMLLPERLRAAHGQHRQAFRNAPSLRQIGLGRGLTARRKDGSEFLVEIGLNPLPGDQDGLVLAAVTDISGRQTMQLELQQANANLEEFTYAASHDLKSPLRGIADLIEWIVEDLGGKAPPEVMRNLGRVSDRVIRLDRVIDDLLAYARAGATSSDAEEVDLHALLDGVLAIQPMPTTFLVRVHIDAQPFITNKTPLESVLRNLISNAVKHHDQLTGTISIRVEDVGRYCVFTVTDDGPGIPAASHERVFRMFQTLAPGNPAHSGIGLALSKRLVESHGGWIKLDSVEGVRGTSFHVWWPRFQWRKPMHKPVTPLSVLLVDDDDVAAEAVVRGLRKHSMDCPIVIAEDGRAALQILRGTHERRIAKPYLVLLDLNMPRMNGLEFLRELRSDKELKGTVVFILTTSGAEADRARAYAESVAGYMVKSGVGPQFSALARFLTEYRASILFA